MSQGKKERDVFAGQRTPELVMQGAAEQMQKSAAEFWRTVFNPLALVPQPFIPFLLKVNPWLAMFT